MSITFGQSVSLKEFLKLPETKPASEYINGKIVQKPMPKGRHSRLQGNLCTVINDIVEAGKIAYAFPELRCTFGGRSIIPDVTVFSWEHIAFAEDGEVQDDFKIYSNENMCVKRAMMNSCSLFFSYWWFYRRYQEKSQDKPDSVILYLFYGQVYFPQTKSVLLFLQYSEPHISNTDDRTIDMSFLSSINSIAVIIFSTHS